MTPKDWNTQEEAIAAAKAEILAAIGSTDARLELGMVKSVQRGVITFHSTKNETVKISPVDITKSVVLHGGAMLQMVLLPLYHGRLLNFTKGGCGMFRYAQIDENGYIISDSHLSSVVEAENMIPLAPDFDLRNKRWNGTDWETYEPEPEPIRPDKTQADMDYLKMMIGGAAE